MDQKRLTHLRQLEAESIHIIREVAAEFSNPVMLYSIGKDSSVMLHLARKAFYPGTLPFPLLHVDTGWKFREMYEFRDRTAVSYTHLIAQTIGLEDALTASLMLNALLIVGALLGLVLTHLLAHRKFLLGSFLLLAATLVVMACLPSGSSLTLLLFVLFSTTISAVSNLVGILPAESFPTDIRSLGVGFATAMSRLGAAVSTGLLPCCLLYTSMFG